MVAGFSEYAVPHATDLPAFEAAHTETPTKLNPLGARGVGEGATIGATPAGGNAVLDALAPLGVTEVSMPMTPMRVWQAIERAREGPSSGPVMGANPLPPNGSQPGRSTPVSLGTKGGDHA